MKLHTIFIGGPADGVLSSVTVGVFEDEEVPFEMRVVRGSDIGDAEKVTAHVYRLLDVEDSPIPNQKMASYTYSHDYNGLPVSLIEHVI
jgi:hypothetical protein